MALSICSRGCVAFICGKKALQGSRGSLDYIWSCHTTEGRSAEFSQPNQPVSVSLWPASDVSSLRRAITEFEEVTTKLGGQSGQTYAHTRERTHAYARAQILFWRGARDQMDRPWPQLDSPFVEHLPMIMGVVPWGGLFALPSR